jgi:hypothetical protein
MHENSRFFGFLPLNKALPKNHDPATNHSLASVARLPFRIHRKLIIM